MLILKRVGSSHEKLYNEQWRIVYFYVAFYYDFLISFHTNRSSHSKMFWNVLKTTVNDLKSRQNPWKIYVKGFMNSKMDFFTDIFQGFAKILRSPFSRTAFSGSHWLLPTQSFHWKWTIKYGLLFWFFYYCLS